MKTIKQEKKELKEALESLDALISQYEEADKEFKRMFSVGRHAVLINCLKNARNAVLDELELLDTVLGD